MLKVLAFAALFPCLSTYPRSGVSCHWPLRLFPSDQGIKSALQGRPSVAELIAWISGYNSLNCFDGRELRRFAEWQVACHWSIMPIDTIALGDLPSDSW